MPDLYDQLNEEIHEDQRAREERRYRDQEHEYQQDQEMLWREKEPPPVHRCTDCGQPLETTAERCHECEPAYQAGKAEMHRWATSRGKYQWRNNE